MYMQIYMYIHLYMYMQVHVFYVDIVKANDRSSQVHILICVYICVHLYTRIQAYANTYIFFYYSSYGVTGRWQKFTGRHSYAIFIH